MKNEGQKWFQELTAYVAACRATRPIAHRDSLVAADEWQCRIIGGSLISWIEEGGPRLIQERAVLARLKNWEKDPFIVFTSEEPGLIAAQEILGEESARVAFLTPAEFSSWLTSHPDPEYRWHVHRWSYFAPLDQETRKKTAKYPLAGGESYWLHKEGTMCGQLFGRGGDHLWKWDGKDPSLLAECLNHWVS